MNFGAGPNLCRWIACISELSRQIHRETTSLGGTHQLFGVGSGTFLETGRERERALEGSAAELHRALAFLERPIPYRRCISNGHFYLLLKTLRLEKIITGLQSLVY